MMDKSKMEIAVIGIIVGFIVLIVFANPLFSLYTHESDVKITVDNKERVVNKDSSKYLVFAENEVFENTDTFIYWKFNSSTIYNNLEKGNTYECDVYGWRVPFFSMYRNIIQCDSVQ